jgi:hypothetical protein
MSQWLLNRLFSAKDQSTTRFAFQGTINWIKALSIYVEEELTFENINTFYSTINRKPLDEKFDTVAFDNLFMALHNIAALEENIKSTNPYNICRSAIVSWYYCIYFSSSAMIAACSNSSQETHADTSNVWQNDIVLHDYAMMPFSLNLESIEKKKSDSVIAELRKNSNFDVINYPTTKKEAFGALVSYLNGTADYERGRYTEKIKFSKEYKKTGFDSFRTKAAREMRDAIFNKHCVNFLVEAFRYRGKSNYRDSIYLSYGDDYSVKIEEFISNLLTVAGGFYKMASCYVSKRVQSGTWEEFSNDIKQNMKIKIDLGKYHKES